MADCSVAQICQRFQMTHKGIDPIIARSMEEKMIKALGGAGKSRVKSERAASKRITRTMIEAEEKREMVLSLLKSDGPLSIEDLIKRIPSMGHVQVKGQLTKLKERQLAKNIGKGSVSLWVAVNTSRP